MVADLISADISRRLVTDIRAIPREVISTRRGNVLKRSGPVGINRRQAASQTQCDAEEVSGNSAFREPE